ncbi:puratrophin-1 isoform X2 [Vanacampus margaritifer]
MASDQDNLHPVVLQNACTLEYVSRARAGAECGQRKRRRPLDSRSRDRSGRFLLTVDAGVDAVWSRPECRPGELLRLMLYYVYTLGAGSPGVTVLVDTRRAAPSAALLSALDAVQEEVPGHVGRVLLLTDAKVGGAHVDRHAPATTPAGAQLEAVSSLESLADEDQLPRELGGSLRFSHSDWLAFRSRVEQLGSQCDDVIKLLQKNIDIMENTRLPGTQQDAERQLSIYRQLMQDVLGDSRLVRLQQEGGAWLSLLRRDLDRDGEGPRRTAVAAVCCSYQRVDELLHRLVAFNNDRTRRLRLVRDFCRAARAFRQVSCWMEGEGQTQLGCLDQSEDSLEALGRKQRDFKDFYSSACARCKEGEAALRRLERWCEAWPWDADSYRAQVGPLRDQLDRFWQRVATVGRNIRKRLALYRFLDGAYAWAIEGRHRLAAMAVKVNILPEECVASLEEHRRRHPPIPEMAFQEMMSLADELRDERGARQLGFARATCREALAMFDKKMADARLAGDSARRRRSRLSSASTETLSGAAAPSAPPPDGPPLAPVSPQRTPLLRRLFGGEPARPRLHSCAVSAPASFPRLLRKTQSFDCPASGAAVRALSEPARRGNTGVFIRGLEVSSAEAADRTLCARTPAPTWAERCRRGPGTPGAESPATAEGRGDGRKLRHIVEEMVTTEREYVRSLRYVTEHYFPEMERADLPQDLRGKRSVVFGNLEKLLDFHAHVFLKELEACWKHPLRVAPSFLRHQEQFSLYALYSKNKPKSDALLASHGLAFFKRKQRELGDKMDLCSYLLKPVQRMSKYALLLDDLIKEVGVGQEAELTSLRTAVATVKFQLRHGNDLLAMDAIRHCDVNLKEQGRLLRQDQFTVWSGRRKCDRRVFLFDELLLLSKAKMVDGGLDVFQYKRSFKTSDLGLTESKGDDGLRFEIWFRRRTSKNQTLTLQAASADVKSAWTRQLAAILWTQASRNKEARLKEMLSMGVGNKPYLDIQPSAAAISDRAVHHVSKIRGARTRASIAVSASDRADPFRRAAETSDPSSAGLLGSLDLHVFRYQPPGGDVAPPCVEEDERERDTATTESSGSSSRCLSGSTGSDSGCVSSRQRDPSSASSGSSHKVGAESVAVPATEV